MRHTAIMLGIASAAATASIMTGASSATATADGAAASERGAGGASTSAGACWYDGGWYCKNRAPVTIYKGPVQDRIPAGTVTTTTSWFKCRAESDYPHGGGGPHPYRWIRTQADDPAGAWGWMEDTDVASETNSLPVC